MFPPRLTAIILVDGYYALLVLDAGAARLKTELRWRSPKMVRPWANRVIMRAMVVREYGKAPVVSEIADPAGPTAEVLAASLNPADAETVLVPGGLDASRAAALGVSGVAAWTGLARTGALRPGESVLVLGANGQVGRVAVQAARLLGARRVAGVVQHEAAREAPLRLGADTVVTSQDLPTLTGRRSWRHGALTTDRRKSYGLGTWELFSGCCSLGRFRGHGGGQRLVIEAAVVRVDGAHDAPADVAQLPGLGFGQRVED
jgi:hypothetical protein